MDPLAVAGITTSEQLVKALKGASPPTASTSTDAHPLTKIQLARAAWSTTTFTIPKKESLLADWVLDALCRSAKAQVPSSAATSSVKGKAKAKAAGNGALDAAPELDADYWALLSAIVQSQSQALGTSRSAVSQWVNGLVASHPIITLSSSLAKSLEQRSQHSSNQALTVSAAYSLSLLLPSAGSRSAAANIENVTEAIQAWLCALPHLDAGSGRQLATTVLEGLLDSWLIALDLGVNARKNARYFLANSLPHYFSALAVSTHQHRPSPAQADLVTSLERIGAASLFTQDVLLAFVGEHADRGMHPALKEANSKVDDELLDQLRTLLKSNDGEVAAATLSSFPVLVRLFTSRLRTEASGLLAPAASSSYSALSAAALQQAQEATIRAIVLNRFVRPLGEMMLKSSVSSAHHTVLASARALMLAEVEALDLYVPGSAESDDWFSFFRSFLSDAIDDLQERRGDTTTLSSEVAQRAFATLQTLWTLEQSVVEPWLTPVLKQVASVAVLSTSWVTEEVFDEEAAAALNLLKTSIASYGKARDVPHLIMNIFDALVQLPHTSAVALNEVQNGILLSSRANDEMASLIRGFLTPMQVVPLLNTLTEKSVEIVQTSRASQERTASPRPNKRRKSEKGSSDVTKFTSSPSSESLCLALQVLTLTLGNVQIPSPVRDDAIAAAERLYNDVVLASIDSSLAHNDWRVLAAALRVRTALLSYQWRHNFDEPMRLDGAPEAEALEILDTSLNARRSQLLDLIGDKVEQDSERAEAIYEAVRTLLQQAERDHMSLRRTSEYTALLSSEGDGGNLVSRLVPLIRDEIVSPAGREVSAPWNGKTTGITNSSALATALWLALTTRWAELIDQLGSSKLLLDLSQMLLASVVLDPLSTDMAGVARQAVRNAHFLELPKWRSAILSIASCKTQVFVKAELVKHRATLAGLQQKLPSAATTEDDQEAFLTLCAMDCFPVEWISRSSRETLLERSLVIDTLIGRGQYASLAGLPRWSSLRHLIAELMSARGAGPDAASEQMVASLALLVTSEPAHGSDAAEQRRFDDISLAAFEVGARNLIESCKMVTSAWSNLLALHHCLAARASLEAVTLAARADQVLLAGIVADGKLMADPQRIEAFWSVVNATMPVQDSVAAQFGAIKALVERFGVTTDDDAILRELVHRLRQVRLGLILTSGCSSDRVSLIAQRTLRSSGRSQILALVEPICATVTQAAAAAGVAAGLDTGSRNNLKVVLRVCAETLRLIAECSTGRGVQEADDAIDTIQQQSEDAAAALKTAIAFSSFASCFDREELVSALAPVLVQIVSGLSADVYGTYIAELMDVLQSAVSTETGPGRQCASLIMAAGISLQSGPERSNRAARKHLSMLLSFFVRLGGNTRQPALIRAMVDVVESICSKRAILLRSIDVELILQLYTLLLAPSSSDVACTATLAASADLGRRIFSAQVASLTSLIRLRPDLMHAYPSLVASVLSSQAGMFRRPKVVGGPALVSSTSAVGAGQRTSSRYLRRDLPSWFDPAHSLPLRAEVEARHYSRLLTSLTLKTSSIVAQHQHRGADARPAKKERKAESLSKPFSKHAIYVLVAYLNAVTNPSSTFPTDVRIELSSGLLALCSVVGKHERDAAMVGLLDSAGKTLFKNLWRKWENERYKGQ